MAAINDTSTWKKIEDHVATSISKTHLKDLLQDEARCSGLVVEHDGLHIDYSRQQVLPETMDMLFELADTAELSKKMQAMSSGAHVNMTENRSVLHFALRSPEGDNIQSDGINVVPNVHAVRKQISDFSARVRGGEWKGCTGKAIKNIISVGIGGSYLGPEFVYESLRNDSKGSAAAKGRTLRFLANVDPVDCSRAVEDLDPETTMICIVSKTFTTAETMMNARTALNWLVDKLLGSSRLGITGMSPQVTRESIVRQHVVAVSTAVEKATKFGIDPANIFPFWDWVGGRYSVCSAVGLLPLSLHYGYDIMSSFLEGASAMDTHFFEAPLRTNLPVILGLLGVYNATFLGYHTRAVLPYSQALCRFPAHIQQLEMESNGKRIHTDGSVCQFNCGEIIFGEPGTNGQHSFYQLIHQGSRIIPCEFIGFVHSQTPMHDQVIDNHDELMSNFFAQPDALAQGKTQQDLIQENVPKNLLTHKEFPGNRPSTTILLPTLNAYTCGQLLALYEHRTAVQGFIWGINSFDQWGVELGKVLGVKVRNTLLEAKHISEIQTDGDSASEDDLSGLNLKGYNHSTQSLLKYYIKQKKHTPSE